MLGKRTGAFRFHPDKKRDIDFFNRVSLELTKIGTPPVQYKCLRVDDTTVDPIFGDASNPVYDPPVEVYVSYVPPEIILELMQFGLSATDEDLNVVVNKRHFIQQTNKEKPQEGDKVLDSRGKVYKVQKKVVDMDNVFFGDTYHFGLTLKLTEEEF